MGKSKEPTGAAERIAALREAELNKLIAFATEIAQGWSASLKDGDERVVWIAIKGQSPMPASSGAADAIIHQLEHDAGIAFVLRIAEMRELLFVVAGRGDTYSVNISNYARPWERSEHLRVHLDHQGDRKRVLTVATRYARHGGP
jgi:hypothetical protein